MEDLPRVDEALARAISNDSTGAVEVRVDRKRWLFFFASGALVFTRSNLKSEQADAVRSRQGDLPPNEITRFQAVRRMRNALRAEAPQVSFHDGASPPQVTPVNAAGALIEAVSQAWNDDQLRERVAPIVQGFPRVTADTGGLGLPPALEQYLRDVDGGRPGADVIDFAPAPPRQVNAALLVLQLLGELDIGDMAQASTQVVGVSAPTTGPVMTPDQAAQAISPPPPQPKAAPAPASPPAAASGDGLDLGSIIGDALATASPAPAPPPEPPPESPADEMTRPMPRPQQPEEHPLAKRLEELSKRIEEAPNHFDVLGVRWDAEPEEFRQAYTALARELHPDRFHDGPDALREKATSLFDKLRLAWEVVSDPERREEHVNVAIRGQKSAEEQAREQLEAYWAADDAFRKGLALFKNGRIQAAHSQFKLAADNVPDQVEFVAYHGYTTYAINRQSNPGAAEQGLAMLRDALERNKNQERQLDSGWALLGRAYREKGELETARRALVHALRLNPANSDATREMRRLEKDAGGRKRGKGFLASLFNRDG